MGQLLSAYFDGYRKDQTLDLKVNSTTEPNSHASDSPIQPNHDYRRTFVDLQLLPRELAFNVLAHLNATDLYLASCVWYNLAVDDLLWQGLCRKTWPFCSAYTNDYFETGSSYRQLYLRMDEARLTFNADAFEGMKYMFKYKLLDDKIEDLLMFFRTAPGLDSHQKGRFMQSRPHLLDALINQKDFNKHFLPNALRRLFSEFHAASTTSISLEFITRLVSAFSTRFVQCNPNLGLTRDEIYVLCFSLIMLSADLWSPHIKNKMSKREFIRNTRQVVTTTPEYLGDLYDNVYMVGHVVLHYLPGPPVRQLDLKNVLLKT